MFAWFLHASVCTVQCVQYESTCIPGPSRALVFNVYVTVLVLLHKQLEWPIRKWPDNASSVNVYASQGNIDLALHTDTQTQRQVYRIILARCILSLAGYGP